MQRFCFTHRQYLSSSAAESSLRQQIVANTLRDIPSSLRWNETQKSLQLANDARNLECQTWYLGRKEKKV